MESLKNIWSSLVKKLFKSRSVGCGPAFLPQWFIDPLFGWFFTASCTKHDGGYTKGGNEFRRLECDVKFFLAMLKDLKGVKFYWIPLAFSEAVVFFLLVRIFGWALFNYT